MFGLILLCNKRRMIFLFLLILEWRLIKSLIVIIINCLLNSGVMVMLLLCRKWLLIRNWMIRECVIIWSILSILIVYLISMLKVVFFFLIVSIENCNLRKSFDGVYFVFIFRIFNWFLNLIVLLCRFCKDYWE